MGSKLHFRNSLLLGLLIFILQPSSADAFSLLLFGPDTLPGDSLTGQKDSIPAKRKSKSQLDSKVEYSAVDSMEFDVENQKILLFGKAAVNYEGTSLKAHFIELGMQDNILYSHGTDSAGKMVGKPQFDDSGQSFTAEEMKYNFKTKKGKIIKAVTKEGEGYLHGDTIKKPNEEILYIKDGKYTTCSQPDPHFHIEATRLKVIKDDKIVTGPAYLVVENAPTPLAVPFGLFPNKKERTSGLIIPSYGQSPNLGFFLTDGGYYFGMNEYFDLKLLGDIYTRGSWAGKVVSAYKRRYKFTGNLDLSYSQFLKGDIEFPDFQKSTNFFVRWKHMQDPKANPTRNFSADVNAGSNSNFTNNINTPSVDYFSNVFKSSVNYQKTFSILNIPSNFNLNGSHDQNTRDSIINIRFPQVTFNVNRFTPFKRKVRIGDVKWYENIGIGYQSLITNSLTFKEGILKDHSAVYYDSNNQKRDTIIPGAPQDTLLSMMRNGMSHNIPVSTSVKFLKYMTFNPQFNYSEKWYIETRKFHWNEDSLNSGVYNRYVIDTARIHQFDRFAEYNAIASFSTTVYGMYNFRSQAVKAVRHMMIPSVGFSYRPDFSEAKFGYFDSLVKPSLRDPSVDTTVLKYTRFQNGILGGPASGKSALLNFSLTNNLEMKVSSKKDTVTGNKKIKIFETLSFSSNYNLLADSMKLAPITIAGRTNLFQALNLNFSGVLNPYRINLYNQLPSGGFSAQRVDTLVWTIPNWWNRGRPLGTFTDAQISLSLNLKGGKKDNEPKTSSAGTEEELAEINKCIDCYVDFNVPWTLNINYNFIYQKPVYNPTITNTFTFNGDVRLSPNWKIGFTSGYDFRGKEFTYTSMDVYRDLHCWEMSVNIIPFGSRKSYIFNINVKSSVLQDLKLTRRRQWFDQ